MDVLGVIASDIEEMKVSLEFTGNEMEQIKVELKVNNSEIVNCKKEIDKLKEDNNYLKKEISWSSYQIELILKKTKGGEFDNTEYS